jgi:hypothetical protein
MDSHMMAEAGSGEGKGPPFSLEIRTRNGNDPFCYMGVQSKKGQSRVIAPLF